MEQLPASVPLQMKHLLQPSVEDYSDSNMSTPVLSSPVPDMKVVDTLSLDFSSPSLSSFLKVNNESTTIRKDDMMISHNETLDDQKEEEEQQSQQEEKSRRKTRPRQKSQNQAGILFKIPFGESVRVLKRDFVKPKKEHLVTNLLMDEDHEFPTSELFYASFAQHPLEQQQQQPKRSLKIFKPQLMETADQELAEDLDEELLLDPDLELDPEEFELKLKKKKKTPKKPRARARNGAEKICCSCRSTQTPIWREVKEQWGDGWEEILLCNACGLQWRMCGLRCFECQYVPRASEKRSKKCTRCHQGFWYRKQ